MGGLHPLRHLDVPQRQVPSHAQHQPATRRAIRKPHGRRPADHRRSQQPHRRIRSALSWTSAAIPATIIGSLVALAGLVPALRLWWQMLFMACAQLVVGPVIFLNGTTIAHVIPTLRTLTQGWMRMLGSFKYLLAIDPPTGTGDGSLLAVWTICLWPRCWPVSSRLRRMAGLRWSRSFPSWRISRSARCLARRAVSTVWRSARLWRSCWWFGSARVGNCWNWAVGSVP